MKNSTSHTHHTHSSYLRACECVFKINLLNYHGVSERVVLVIQAEGHVTKIKFVRFCCLHFSLVRFVSQFPEVYNNSICVAYLQSTKENWKIKDRNNVTERDRDMEEDLSS